MQIVFVVVIVGGGPAALSEVLRLDRKRVRRVALISDQLGGCMAMLGEQPLQSYICELEIQGVAHPLEAFMKKRALSPTGAEYADYIATNLRKTGVTLVSARVVGLDKHDHVFSLMLEGHSGIEQVKARQVILATGIKPRPWPKQASWRPDLSCFEAYHELQAGRHEGFAGKDIYLLGSGNTAFQLAAALAPIARCVTVLVTRYLGVFPLETDDRFALRALSQRALELVAKTVMHNEPGALNEAGVQPKLWLHAYEAIDERAGRLRLTLPHRLNRHPLLGASCQAALLDGRITHTEQGFELPIDLHDDSTLVISATGVTASFPDMPWPGLIDAETGFVVNRQGSTPVAGLYVAGAMCGYASVNTMLPTAPGNGSPDADRFSDGPVRHYPKQVYS